MSDAVKPPEALSSKPGPVQLVGAGPSGVELLTLAARAAAELGDCPTLIIFGHVIDHRPQEADREQASQTSTCRVFDHA